MRKILWTIALLAIILTACNKTNTPTAAVVADPTPIEEKIPLNAIETAEETTNTEEPEENTETTPAELPPVPIESKIIIEKSRQFSPELRDLLQKADSEVKSVTYMYAESPNNIGFDTYLIKGTKMKILLFEKNDYIIDDYFNVVYVDTAAKTAKARCENKKRCLSKTIDNTKRVYELNYNEYRTKTPYEWIKEVQTAEIIGLETLNKHAVTRIKTNIRDTEVEMWVDNRFGLPHRIKATKDSEETTYYFKNMMFNGIRDSDVVMKN